jgi:hypothetical protein
MESTVTVQAAWLIGTIFWIHVLRGCFHPLYLSPLVAIPGPRVAALTSAYEKHYDLIQKARFPWKIEQLHKQYGGASNVLCIEETVLTQRHPLCCVRMAPP